MEVRSALLRFGAVCAIDPPPDRRTSFLARPSNARNASERIVASGRFPSSRLSVSSGQADGPNRTVQGRVS